MAGFTALVSKHLYLGMIVSCHFDIIPGFLDQVRCSWHDKSTVPHCNTQPSINHPLPALISLPEPAAVDKAAHRHHCSFCHRGAPGPHDSPANYTTAICKLGIWCRRGGSWAGRCHTRSKHGHCFKWCMSGHGVFFSGGEGGCLWRNRQKVVCKNAHPSPQEGLRGCLGTSTGSLHTRGFSALPPHLDWLCTCPARGWDSCSSPPLSLLVWQTHRPSGERGSCKWCFWQDSR